MTKKMYIPENSLTGGASLYAACKLKTALYAGLKKEAYNAP